LTLTRLEQSLHSVTTAKVTVRPFADHQRRNVIRSGNYFKLLLHVIKRFCSILVKFGKISGFFFKPEVMNSRPMLPTRFALALVLLPHSRLLNIDYRHDNVGGGMTLLGVEQICTGTEGPFRAREEA